MITIAADSREQERHTSRYRFDRFKCTVERGVKLDAGDYSVLGIHEPGPCSVSVERKTVPDLIGCLKEGKGGGRERFERMLHQARYYDRFFVVVEGDYQEIREELYRSKMTGAAIRESISAFIIRYGVMFYFAGSREGAEEITFSLLSKYAEEISKRFKTLQKGQAA